MCQDPSLSEARRLAAMLCVSKLSNISEEHQANIRQAIDSEKLLGNDLLDGTDEMI